MDELSTEIIEIVRECNRTGEDIYQKKLIEKLRNERSPLTIHKRIRWLVDCGELSVKFVPGKQGTFKMLFVKINEIENNSMNITEDENALTDLFTNDRDDLRGDMDQFRYLLLRMVSMIENKKISFSSILEHFKK